MIVETLSSLSGPVFVSLCQVVNTKGLSKDDLISLATQPERGIHATQFLDASLIAGPHHLLSAAQNALNAHNGNYALARGLDIEIIVYASLQRQIGRAFELIGITDKPNTIAITVLGSDAERVTAHTEELISSIGSEQDPPFIQSSEDIERFITQFEIPISELKILGYSDDLDSKRKALTKSVVSRVTMVALDS